MADWFNRSAPAVKSGEVVPERLDAEQALALMLQEPLLIRRPLMELGALRQSGFVPGPVLEALDVALDPKQDLQSCPIEPGTAEAGPVCEAPA